MLHIRCRPCWFPSHQALAYCSLATCPRESLWRAACHMQPMHTKRKMVCTGLQEAMLLSTALMTIWMAPSQTALLSILACISAVQFVQTTCRLIYRDIPIFYLKLAITLEGLQKRKLKLFHTSHTYKLYILCRFENMPKGLWQRSFGHGIQGHCKRRKAVQQEELTSRQWDSEERLAKLKKTECKKE